MTHRALIERDVPPVLIKITPPKSMAGHSAPDFLWTILLIVFIIFLLDRLGVLR